LMVDRRVHRVRTFFWVYVERQKLCTQSTQVAYPGVPLSAAKKNMGWVYEKR